MPILKSLKSNDPDVYNLIVGENERQKNGMELIASENYISEPVLEAMGTIFNNKYAEGYPGNRYYGGQEYTDKIENLARERAKKLFKAEYANVQPHSGADANIATYFSILEPGDTILGMDLSHGGHLTHGHPVTHLSKIFNFVRYGMKDINTGEIDYDEMREIAKKEKPKLLLCGFSAYPRELDYEKIKKIADEVGAITMMDMAHIAGMIAGGSLANPFDFGFDIVTTTTHKSLRGPRGGMILAKKEFEKKINKGVFPGFQGGPIMQIIAAKAVAFKEAMSDDFKIYAKNILKNTQAMVKVFLDNNARLITGGSDNHMLLIDCVESFGITGKEAQEILDEANITTNKNAIADDKRSPMDPSGIRLGSQAMTTRGINEDDSRKIAEFVVEVCKNSKDKLVVEEIKNKVIKFCDKFPLPGENS